MENKSSKNTENIDLTPPKNGEFWVSREVKVRDSVLQYGVQADEEGGGVKIFSVRTPVAKRGQGSARAAMEEFLSAADLAGKAVTLDASSLDRKTSTAKLVAFYSSLGFEATGRTVNPLGEPEMARHPIPQKKRTLRPS